jgi:NAD(P)-dependent dehydrogenase (short-subunit alcohol dehydrogenase family)
MRVLNKVFVVTGGGNGIGREAALELLGRGARVAAVDLSEPAWRRPRRLPVRWEERLTTHVLDITDRSAAEALPAVVTADHAAVDGLVNVAGIIHRFVPIRDLRSRRSSEWWRSTSGAPSICARRFFRCLRHGQKQR